MLRGRRVVDRTEERREAMEEESLEIWDSQPMVGFYAPKSCALCTYLLGKCS